MGLENNSDNTEERRIKLFKEKLEIQMEENEMG